MVRNLNRSTALRRVLWPVLVLVASTLVVAAAPAQAAVLPTTTTLAVSDADVIEGDSVTLTASVSISGGGGLLVTPSGNVTFTADTASGSKHLGSSSVPPGCVPGGTPCQAKLTTTALPVGDVLVTARYAGDAVTQPSSGTAQVTVTAAPPTLTATDQIGSVSLRWTTNSSAAIASYSLYRSPTSGGTLTKIASDLPTGDYQDTTVPTGTTFFYRATAVDTAGNESAYSNEASGQSLAFGGGSTFSTTQCPSGQTCTSPVVSGSSPDGSTTSLGAMTTKSASPHTLTTAVGGPNLVACSDNTERWLSTTFNDTSSDAHKIVGVLLNGPAAAYMKNESGYRDHEIGCIGLGQPWITAPDGAPAQWSPADGLYVGTAFYCRDMSEYKVGKIEGIERYSQPCLHAGYYDGWFGMVYQLPPGDGRISGSP